MAGNTGRAPEPLLVNGIKRTFLLQIYNCCLIFQYQVHRFHKLNHQCQKCQPIKIQLNFKCSLLSMGAHDMHHRGSLYYKKVKLSPCLSGERRLALCIHNFSSRFRITTLHTSPYLWDKNSQYLVDSRLDWSQNWCGHHGN
jgi:hypothetical protein